MDGWIDDAIVSATKSTASDSAPKTKSNSALSRFVRICQGSQWSHLQIHMALPGQFKSGKRDSTRAYLITIDYTHVWINRSRPSCQLRGGGEVPSVDRAPEPHVLQRSLEIPGSLKVSPEHSRAFLFRFSHSSILLYRHLPEAFEAVAPRVYGASKFIQQIHRPNFFCKGH